MREYSVDIEARAERWPVRDERDALEDLLEELPRLGAMGAIAHGKIPETVGARFHVKADEPEEAVPFALRIFRAAAERVGLVLGEIEFVEAVTDERLQRDLEQPPDTYLGVSEVARLLGVSKQRVSELRSRPDFPAPVAELASGPVWRGSQLRRFLEGWPRRPGRPPTVESLARSLARTPEGVLTARDMQVIRAVVETLDRGASLREAAERLGVKPGTVRARLRRAAARVGLEQSVREAS